MKSEEAVEQLLEIFHRMREEAWAKASLWRKARILYAEWKYLRFKPWLRKHGFKRL